MHIDECPFVERYPVLEDGFPAFEAHECTELFIDFCERDGARGVVTEREPQRLIVADEFVAAHADGLVPQERELFARDERVCIAELFAERYIEIDARRLVVDDDLRPAVRLLARILVFRVIRRVCGRVRAWDIGPCCPVIRRYGHRRGCAVGPVIEWWGAACS